MKIMLPTQSPMMSKAFTFGVATASFQIEGAADTRLANIWDTFCATPGNIRDGSDGKQACEHVNLWKQDIDLIESLGVDAYRLSISWPRVMNQDGSLNAIGVNFYIQLLDELKQRNIKAFVTLYHWDLPQHIEDNGGWLNRETAYLFNDYANKISQVFADRVYSYATFNEPFCSAYLGYELGIHAPGKAKVKYGRQAAHHILLAHGLAMKTLQQNSPNSLNGIVLNFTPCYPETDSEQDHQAATLADEYMNQWYIKPLFDGCYPDSFALLSAQDAPKIEAGDFDIIRQPLDFLGINFYTRAVYRHCHQKHYQQVDMSMNPKTDIGWEIYPQAFTDLLMTLHQQYTLPPVFITENGAAIADKLDNGQVNDLDRISYYQQHLSAVNNAMLQGVNVAGYFAWSLMDNFEWAEGYLKRFGIVYVDYPSQKRTIKNSGLAYRDLLNSRL
ncbi:GH1 family beta-glucosidase [Shewanella intestini]|uniref:Beta-glucosidase n=1 Tax=Shewanella intestini TaxID=2017544 RepID=A0ABS5HYH7_9GAMM|nr:MULTISPECIES: GH1 family beta-glucosidase [Shewanella]MBR9726838.1 beta-glucosidase [Shewanella intestini]MRG34596.1 beta-glucosidase [Shewanella sp. XMDDZSB0408]